MDISIDINIYNKLLKDQNKLMALENAGVDNWEGYDYAMELLEESEDEQEGEDK